MFECMFGNCNGAMERSKCRCILCTMHTYSYVIIHQAATWSSECLGCCGCIELNWRKVIWRNGISSFLDWFYSYIIWMMLCQRSLNVVNLYPIGWDYLHCITWSFSSRTNAAHNIRRPVLLREHEAKTQTIVYNRVCVGCALSRKLEKAVMCLKFIFIYLRVEWKYTAFCWYWSAGTETETIKP